MRVALACACSLVIIIIMLLGSFVKASFNFHMKRLNARLRAFSSSQDPFINAQYSPSGPMLVPSAPYTPTWTRVATPRTFTRRTTRLYWASDQREKRAESSSSSSSSSSVLSWETFDYGSTPKWDDRFANNRTVIIRNEQELEQMAAEEAAEDVKAAQKLHQQALAWQQLSPEWVDQATSILLPYVREDRRQRIESVLQQRTCHTRFLFENPSNPSNVWSCLRTLDAFGIQHVDVIIQSGRYVGKAALSQKQGMRTAMGSARWLTLRNHPSTEQAVATLKAQCNCLLVAADVNATAQDIRFIDWDSLGRRADQNQPPATQDDVSSATPSWQHDHAGVDRPICIVMGNEDSGISDEMRALCDATFYLPMVGFAESFNLSVATAITLAHLSAASSQIPVPGTSPRGPLRPGDLPEREYKCLLLKGILNSMPQKKMAAALLRKEGLEMPPEISLL